MKRKENAPVEFDDMLSRSVSWSVGWSVSLDSGVV